MGMRDYPNCGYVVEVKELSKLFKGELLSNFLDILENENVDKVTEFLSINLPDDILPSFYVFQLNDTDFSEDLKTGIMYICIDENSLYQKSPTDMLIKLENLEIYPEKRLWTTWG